LGSATWDWEKRRRCKKPEKPAHYIHSSGDWAVFLMTVSTAAQQDFSKVQIKVTKFPATSTCSRALVETLPPQSVTMES
jgi:hypothetical protein